MPKIRGFRGPLLLDLFCGAGGASRGYYDAGFDVVGVDIAPQGRYPFRFIQADALTFDVSDCVDLAFIHASPPCQAYSYLRSMSDTEHPDLIPATRTLLEAAAVPYVIENVPGSPLLDPITLCGAMFDLRTYRHRLFESPLPLVAPPHPAHVARNGKLGRQAAPTEFMHVVGHFTNVREGRAAMGIDWMGRDELSQAIPPAYTRCIGEQLPLIL